MQKLLAAVAVFSIGLIPALVQAQTVTVEAEAQVPAPPPQQQPPPPQGQVVVQPAPQQYGQPQQQPQYYQPAPVPQREQRTRSRPIWGLVIPGAVVLGVSWILHAAVVSPFAGYSATSGFQPDWATFRWTGLIPVAGPWIQLAVKPGGFEDSWAGYLVVDGLLQAAGLTMLILGIAIQEEETYYVRGEGGSGFAIVPTADQNGGGLAAVGRF